MLIFRDPGKLPPRPPCRRTMDPTRMGVVHLRHGGPVPSGAILDRHTSAPRFCGHSIAVSDRDNHKIVEKKGDECGTIVTTSSQPHNAMRKHQAMYVDVGDSSSVQQLFKAIGNTYSEPLSILVNGAGILRQAPILQCTDELFDDIVRVNLRVSLYACLED
ncbi:hypothetical protein MTO96_029924 [Rhipicephalus appendiculatus]